MIAAVVIWLLAATCAAIRGDWAVVFVSAAFALVLLVAIGDGLMAERRRRAP